MSSQDYEERIASLQEQVERNSLMSSIVRFDVEAEDDDDCMYLIHIAVQTHFTLSTFREIDCYTQSFCRMFLTQFMTLTDID